MGFSASLDDMPYHLADSAWSPRRVLRENTSHCYEGALFAAAALRVIGYPPLILDLEAEHDTDHVIAVYQGRMDIGERWPNRITPDAGIASRCTGRCANWL